MTVDRCPNYPFRERMELRIRIALSFALPKHIIVAIHKPTLRCAPLRGRPLEKGIGAFVLRRRSGLFYGVDGVRQ